jgi:hypothetical protein
MIQGTEGTAREVEEIERFLEAAAESEDIHDQVFALQFSHFESTTLFCRVHGFAA